jgi:hypothetical protein
VPGVVNRKTLRAIFRFVLILMIVYASLHEENQIESQNHQQTKDNRQGQESGLAHAGQSLKLARLTFL